MKKVFILATAAIVALASCAKTKVVYNGQPEEIAFKQITGAMTKASTNLGTGDYVSVATMGVFAEYGTDLYINNEAFSCSDAVNNYWKATPSKYWPYEGTLDFTVYAPKGTAELDVTKTKLTVSGIEASNTVLYGKEKYEGFDKDDASVPVELKHACAKITVKVTGTEVFTMESLTLKTAPTEGSYTVDYSADPATVTAVATKNDDYVFTQIPSSKLNATAQEFETIYVLPGDQTAFDISFTQDGITSAFDKSISLSPETWEANKHYIYTIDITASEIILIPTVLDWDSPEETKNLDNDDLI